MRAQGGDPCRTSSFRPGGRFCPDVSVPATFYHSLSLSRDVADRFRITLGVANLFDTPPPRVSTVVTATPPVIGQAPAFGTQYEIGSAWCRRRGCQYGSIAVVAVSLTKNRHYTCHTDG